MFKTKILILGPCESGKTTIANYLADSTEITGGDYRPTQGIRIVEFESNDLELNGKKIDAEVELWDCSGDRKFEKCWPAIQKDTHGVILVLNPNTPSHMKDIEQWYIAFVARRGIKQNHVIVFLHSKPAATLTEDQRQRQLEQTSEATFRLPQMMQGGVKVVVTNIEEDGESVRYEFNNFLINVISGGMQQQQQRRQSADKPASLPTSPPPPPIVVDSSANEHEQQQQQEEE